MESLNTLLAAEFRERLKEDPEMAEEFESKYQIRGWIKETITEELEGLESPAMKTWLKRHIDLKVIMSEL